MTTQSMGGHRAGPVFVTGYQRSGTTLLGTILDRHPRLAIFVESFFLPKYHLARWLYSPLRKTENAVRLAQAIVEEPSSKLNDLQLPEGRIRALEDPTYPDIIHAMMEEWAEARGKTRWGDKSPGYIMRLPVLHRVFPDAKFVHIIRDGRDVFLSVKRLEWADDAGKVGIEWSRAVRKARTFGATPETSSSYMEIQYEDLITDPENIIRSICEFIEEDYTDSLLEPGQRATQIQQLKEWPKVHEKIDSSNTARWKKQMTPRELALFESAAGGLLSDLSYPLSPAHKETVSLTLGRLARRGSLAIESTARRVGTAASLVAARLRSPGP